jgi:hypothetical protein
MLLFVLAFAAARAAAGSHLYRGGWITIGDFDFFAYLDNGLFRNRAFTFHKPQVC